MASTRFRKAFVYNDDDTNTQPETGIDEQEQEQIIDTLRRQDESSNRMYRLLLLVPAIVVLTIYLFTFTLSTPRSNNFLKHVLQRVACVLSVAISILVLADPEYFADFKSAQLNPPALLTAAKPYLILFNFFLIVFFYFVYQASPQADMEYAQWPIPHKYEAGPAIGLCLISWLADRELRPVDINELEQLRYQYKGA